MIAVMINTRLRGKEIAQSQSDTVLVLRQEAFRDLVGELTELAPTLYDGTP